MKIQIFNIYVDNIYTQRLLLYEGDSYDQMIRIFEVCDYNNWGDIS